MGMFIKRCVSFRSYECASDVDLGLQAYLEFFVSPSQLATLISRISRDSNITYYAINNKGDLRTNNNSDGPNAVTWGIFPGKEVIQPTIVEAVSFMAWKAS
jgi:methylenetetrahydrofolate reductase (NADPH)